MVWLVLSVLCEIEVVKIGTIVSFQILEEKFFTIEYDACSEFVINELCYVEICSLYTKFVMN